MASSITIGIAGMTGKFARLLTTTLLETYPEVKIKGLVRTPSKVAEHIASSPNVELVQGDAFEKDKLQTFVRGCDVVVCCYLGDNNLMVEGQKALIDAADQEHVPRYVASDWSLDWTKLKRGELFAKEPCQIIYAYLQEKKNIKGVHILIGGFTDVLFAPFFRLWNPETLTFQCYGTGEERWETTSYLNSAQFTAAVCVDNEATGVLRFVGDTLSITDMAKTFEKVYNIKPKLELLGSLDDLRTLMISGREKHGRDVFKYLFYWYHYFTLNGQALMGPPYDNDKYPQVKPVTVEEFMRAREPKTLGMSTFPWEDIASHA